jgi:dethiobiotin synthetase
VTLAESTKPDTVVLVATPELGTINAVLLAVAALPHPAPVVYLNRYRERNPLHARNAQWLRHHEGLDVVTDVSPLLSRLA